MCGEAQAEPATLSRIAPNGCQESPFNNTLVEIQLEKPGRCTRLRRQRLDEGSTKLKMIFPTLMPRMEQRNELSAGNVERADITPLPCVAPKASEGKIAGLRLSTVLTADDVIYLVGRIGVVLVEKTVLTTIARALCYESP